VVSADLNRRYICLKVECLVVTHDLARATMSRIPLDEIVAGSSVDVAMIRGVQYLPIRDLIMHCGGKNAKAANKTWERMPDDMKEELATFCTSFQFSGTGKKLQPVISFKGALKLVMMIGGENAKRFRLKMAGILTRFYAGDDSLMEEIQSNGQSAAPIAQMARASMLADAAPDAPIAIASLLSVDAAPDAPIAIASLLSDDVAPVQYELVLSNKRKLEELEIAKLELDMDAKRADIEAKKAETKNMQMERLTKCFTSYKETCKDVDMGRRAKTVFKDLYLNMAKQEGNPGPVASDDEISEDDIPVEDKLFNLVNVAHGIGIHPQSFAILTPVHIEVMKRYVEVHGQSPLERKHLYCPNTIVDTLYNECDRPMMEEVLRSMLG
jgi:hypothetical protein